MLINQGPRETTVKGTILGYLWTVSFLAVLLEQHSKKKACTFWIYDISKITISNMVSPKGQNSNPQTKNTIFETDIF